MALDGGLSLAADPETEYLRAVESSTCLLLASPSPTPTPPHPLTDINLLSGDDACSGHLSAGDGGEDSSSSGSSSVALPQDPVSAQLINNISMLEYQCLTKSDRSDVVESGECKASGAGGALGSGRALPSLVQWNWSLVRRGAAAAALAALVACAAAIAALLATLPPTCDPALPWFHGSLFYEVFTASFQDSNKDAYGDLRGLANRLDYIEDLGAKAIRLNYIFEATEYPEHYTEVTNATKIAAHIGTMKDFQELVTRVHDRNMSIVLDIPVARLLNTNTTDDLVAHTLAFWTENGVDGFYLKTLEHFIHDPHFDSALRRWKDAVGYDRILIVSYATYTSGGDKARASLLSLVDLIDVPLRTSRDPGDVGKQIDAVLAGPLLSEPTNPWVLWSAGGAESARLHDGAGARDAPALLLLALALPGSVSIFYGDEIGLRGPPDPPESDFPERALVANLVAMRWRGSDDCGARPGGVLPWNCGDERPDFGLAAVVSSAARLRGRTPTLYAAWTQSDGAWRANAARRRAPGLVLERWLPRRHSYVMLANLASDSLRADLSGAFYAGTVVAATNTTAVGSYLYFDRVTLQPHEGFIVMLEK